MRPCCLAVALALGVLVAPRTWSASKCDPAGADLEAIAAARRAVEAACDCDGFASHRLYVDCAQNATAVAVGAGELSPSCGHAVRRIARRSSCSHTRPRVTCCRESLRSGKRTCVVSSPEHCVSNGSSTRTACGATPFCADTRCDLKAPPPACGPELLYGPEGNRLRRYDIDTIAAPPLVEDIFIERASLGGLDINGQVCTDGNGRFVTGEDTGQPTNVPGFALFDAGGTRIGKLVPTFQTELPGATSTNDPYGCAFDAAGRLFTTDIGNNASGPGNGQLVMWFPPYDRFPGPPGTYPNSDHSTGFCKLATDIATAGGVAVDPQGRVYVTSARGGAVYRFSPPFPTSPDAAGGCGGTDGLGSPVADVVQRETFLVGAGFRTFTGIARAPNGNWFVSAVFNGLIEEYDPNGVFLRTVVAPAPGESALPLSVGHPQGLAVDCRGDLYYADLNLRIGGGGIGPGPDGKVRHVPFDACGVPGPNEIVRQGLAFPDGLGVLPGDLEGP